MFENTGQRAAWRQFPHQCNGAAPSNFRPHHPGASPSGVLNQDVGYPSTYQYPDTTPNATVCAHAQPYLHHPGPLNSMTFGQYKTLSPQIVFVLTRIHSSWYLRSAATKNGPTPSL